MQFRHPMALTRTASTGGPSAKWERTHGKRGEKRDPNKPANTQSQASSSAFHNQQISFEPVAPLQATANRWDRKTFQADGDSLEMVECKVNGLLNLVSFYYLLPSPSRLPF